MPIKKPTNVGTRRRQPKKAISNVGANKRGSRTKGNTTKQGTVKVAQQDKDVVAPNVVPSSQASIGAAKLKKQTVLKEHFINTKEEKADSSSLNKYGNDEDDLRFQDDEFSDPEFVSENELAQWLTAHCTPNTKDEPMDAATSEEVGNSLGAINSAGSLEGGDSEAGVNEPHKEAEYWVEQERILCMGEWQATEDVYHVVPDAFDAGGAILKEEEEGGEFIGKEDARAKRTRWAESEEHLRVVEGMSCAKDMDPQERKRQYVAMNRALARPNVPPAVLARWARDRQSKQASFQFLKEWMQDPRGFAKIKVTAIDFRESREYGQMEKHWVMWKDLTAQYGDDADTVKWLEGGRKNFNGAVSEVDATI